MCTSFACTVLAARAVNYVREQRRPLPAVRSRTRRLRTAPQSSDLRVHHFVPGVGVVAAAGGAGILSRADTIGVLLSAPFGSGLALTLDEVALLVNRKNPYWTSQKLALSEAALAAITALSLAARIYARGRTAER